VECAPGTTTYEVTVIGPAKPFATVNPLQLPLLTDASGDMTVTIDVAFYGVSAGSGSP
jgi:hypothetical protein